MTFPPTTEYLLGIDLGVLSLGWAAVELDGGQPVRLLDMGVRVWELEGISEADVAQGKETPPSQLRRQCRQARRQLFRRAQRLRRTYRVLQQLGLFPQGSWNSQQRKQFLEALDQQARDWLCQNIWAGQHHPSAAHNWIYQLRAAALDRPLPLPLLGRVFFHLAQRRGFQTSARIQAKDEEERGKIKKSISELQKAIQAARARTLGEYLSQIPPTQHIRGRWTSRLMYLQEFEAIWSAQAQFHPQLDANAKMKIQKALFFQRPLKPQRSLVGRCPLETLIHLGPDGKRKTLYAHRRAPMASLEAQQIRYIQRINDLEFTGPQGQRRCLTPKDRRRLYQLAETKEEISFSDIRKLLGIPTGKQGRLWKCNLEEGGEKKLPGNRTAARLRRILGDAAWEQLGPDKQKQLVDTLIAFLDQTALQQHLQTRWGFPESIASQLAQLELESKYHSFSRRAIRKLLPLLRDEGLRLNEAIERLYGHRKFSTPVYDFLPPFRNVFPTVNNPLLIRALTELRKVANALVRRYGKPTLVRIELARDLKRPRKQREALSERMRKQEHRRRKAAEMIRQQFGREPKPFEILKVLLAEECHWECPYTGRRITLDNLLGPSPQFDVEHIWPFPRSLDDSFLNKTLCYHEENRLRKTNRTPYEAYGSDPQRWAEILSRVQQFQGPFAPAKLERFLAKELPEDFPHRHLSDTRWISRQAADYLGLWYGGRIDAAGRQRVFTTAGPLTALVRRAWDLDRILGGDEEKNRFDHRQHAIDALVVAMTDPATVAALTWAAVRLSRVRSRPTPQIEPPWPDFFQKVRDRVHSLLVSFRPHHRVSGPLHRQTYYAPPRDLTNQPQTIKTKVRKPLANLSPDAVEEIVDQKVRSLVQRKLQQLGQPPAKAFTNPENLPRITTRTGQEIPIKSVRVWETLSVFAIGSGPTFRCVTSGANHHLEIFAHLDEQGNEREWDGKIVSLWEAVQRVRSGQPVVCRDHGEGARFKFSLAKGDYIEWTNDQGQREILRVVGISHNDLEFRLPFDARPSTLVKKQRIRARYRTLFQRKARKVTVSPLGEVFPAHD